MNALLLTCDLMVVSRVEGAATRNGLKVHTLSTVEQAVEYMAREPAAVLLVDLASQSVGVRELVDEVRRAGSEKTCIIAFGPHVHEERLNAARQAGCDQVVSRGQFLMQLDAILEPFKVV
jgi:DNA-binding response OmpR family regulator